jgi:predicted ArsR family transcriptional regulator
MQHVRDDAFDGTRGRIVGLLRQGGFTVGDISSRLGLSHNAVRVQITRLERDGLVRRARTERRTTRPSHVFELSPTAQQLLSKAYIPFLTRFVQLVASRQSKDEFDELMRAAGRTLAEGFRHRVTGGALETRLSAASALLNEEFGAVTRVERTNGTLIIRGHGCPLAALTSKHPAVCLAVESLLTELVNVPLAECCTRREPPECCFEAQAPPMASSPSTRDR